MSGAGKRPGWFYEVIDAEWDEQDRPERITKSEARSLASSAYTDDPRPSKEVIADRDIRSMLPHRDLVGRLMGDPPIGLSALDKKKRKRLT